jgi:hypothetical protein
MHKDLGYGIQPSQKASYKTPPWVLAYINKNHIFHRDSSIEKIKIVYGLFY